MGKRGAKRYKGIDYSKKVRLNATQWQRKKRLTVTRHHFANWHKAPVVTINGYTSTTSKQSPRMLAASQAFNKYQTQQGMRANAKGSWNHQSYFIS